MHEQDRKRCRGKGREGKVKESKVTSQQSCQPEQVLSYQVVPEHTYTLHSHDSAPYQDWVHHLKQASRDICIVKKIKNQECQRPKGNQQRERER